MNPDSIAKGNIPIVDDIPDNLRLLSSTLSDRVCLIFKDNGKGFSYNQQTNGYGLKGMQERVTVVNGHFHLTTEPGAGCRLEVEIFLVEKMP